MMKWSIEKSWGAYYVVLYHTRTFKPDEEGAILLAIIIFWLLFHKTFPWYEIFLVGLLAFDIEMDEGIFETYFLCNFSLVFKCVFIMECRTSSFGSLWMGYSNASIPVSCNFDYSGMSFFLPYIVFGGNWKSFK